MLLEPGNTCWRRETSARAALIVDMADYFDAAMAAMREAKHTVHLLNWAFEPQTLFHPQPGCTGPEDDRIANFLKRLARDNPGLDVRVLCWQSALPVAATQNWFPLADRKTFAGSNVKFVLDGKLPMGASHHQKAIVIDDAIAFCGGGDIGPDRWDTHHHLDDDPRREMTKHAHGNHEKDFDSRHEVMGIVEGPAAKALGVLFRERWARCTGETPPEPPKTRPAWPAGLKPQFKDIEVGLSRTHGAWKHHPEVREIEALHLGCIAEARRCIYMENQYFTSPLIAAALATRLREPDGPEVVLIGTEHSPSFFDQSTMDRTRVRFIEKLKRADKHGRFQAYSPVTTLGRIIIVHAKLTIVDDRLLRIGSANINNRSMGLDTECDLSFEATGRAATGARAEILRLRTHLLAHWLGCDDAIVETAIREAGGVSAGLEALRNAGYARLRPIELPPVKGVAAVIATYHMGDPFSPADGWRPWRRKIMSQSAERRGREAMKALAS
ncbi:MAG TPA: phospholipase D-like domain-containing protein [Phenylobacterium sp.]|uniref:phospholipase D-like domain-containing protein n=1 Tax=Phenylobacterium sp. TaxID=1871053 RepID=UPI002D228A4E|nr:phospholipase D-like domain-containing protein [Phenylobacterium sp.]HZZ70372.1 phospholipase D-like domain-containing protein [Phenylobacterium sp.]